MGATRIVSIIPAQPEWYALYAGMEERGQIWRLPIVAWALLGDGQSASSAGPLYPIVVRVSGSGTFVEDGAGRRYLGISPPDDDLENWRAEAERRFDAVYEPEPETRGEGTKR